MTVAEFKNRIQGDIDAFVKEWESGNKAQPDRYPESLDQYEDWLEQLQAWVSMEPL